MAQRPPPREISVVVPCHDEALNLVALAAALTPVLETVGADHEIVLVDDGSRDATWAVIRDLAARDSRIQGVRLTRNFGQQAAILAGLGRARGDVAVTMDADLQHPPDVIPLLLDQWREGAKVVDTLRKDADDAGVVKRVTSRWFYRVFSAMTGVPLAPGSGEFRLLDRKVVDALLQLRDGEYFLRGLIKWMGFRTRTVAFQASRRHAGRTNYSLSRMLGFGLSGITAFSMTPLRIGTTIGLATAVLAFLELGYVLVQVSRGATVPGWASAVGVTVLLFGVQFILLGIIGEYLGRAYMAAKGRPPFVVEEATSDSTPKAVRQPIVSEARSPR